MADVNIKATLSVDSGNSAKSINDLKSEIVDSKKAMESAAIGSDAFQKAQAELSARQKELIESTKNATSANTGLTKTFDKLAANLTPTINNLKALKLQLKDTAVGSKEFDELSAQIRDMDDAISDAKATNDDFLGQLENAPGVLGMLGKGIRGTERTFSSFSGALKASGIGLIVALLGGLAAAFSENEGAMKKLQPLLDGVSKIFQGVFRAVEPLFNTMVDLAMKALPMVTKGIGMVYSAMMGYFTFLKESGTGALKILKGVFTLDTDTIKEGMNQIGGSFKKTAESYNESMKRFAAGSKELTANEKLSAEERKAIREKEIADKEAKDAKAKADKEAKDAKDKADKEKAIEDKKKEDAAYIAATLERLQKEQAIKDEADLILSGLEAQDEADKEAKRQASVDKQVEQGKTLETQVKVRDDLNKQVATNQVERQAELATLEDNAIKLFGKNSAIGKGIALKNAIINTKEGITSALAAKSTLPSPFDVVAKIANVAVVAKSGYDAVKGILAVNIPGSSGGTAPSAPTATAPLTPQASATNLTASSIQGIGNAATGGTSRAYVLDSDIKDNEERNARINRAARII